MRDLLHFLRALGCLLAYFAVFVAFVRCAVWFMGMLPQPGI